MSNILFSASFACVSTLGEFMDALVIGGQCIRSDDSADFKRFLETTLVGHRKIKSRLAFHEPVEKLADTAVKVIKWILQSESKGTESGGYRNQKPFKRNMLALGYDMCKDGSTNCVKGVRELSSQCINSSMIELAKHRWAALLDRTGTSAMMYLLQKTSVFVPLCNASYNQICGVPFVKMEAPPPDIMPVPGISTIISPDTQRKRRGARIRTQPKRRKLCTIEHLSRTASSISDTSGSLADAIGEDTSTGANDIRPSLASIVIDRGRMLYNTPRLAQHKIVWDLLADFPLNRCKTADNLLEQIFVLMPDAAAEPPEALRTLCKRMLKLYKKFQFRFHLFRKCPAPWQVKDSGFNPSTFTATFSDNPFDSDDEETGVDRCNGRIPFSNKHPATAARPAFNSSNNTLSQLLLLQTPTPLDSDASTYSQVIGDGRCVPQAATEGNIGEDDAVGAALKTKKAKRGAKSGSSQSGKATNGAGDRGGDGHVQPNVVDMANTHSQVHSFLQLCIASVVPRDMIGGRGNHRRLYKVLHELVFLGRHDGLRLGPAMHGFKLCEAAAWLDPRERNAASMYACVVHWLISQYALQLVRCFFYVTEASLHGSKLFYFRKDVWNTVTRDAWKSLVSDMFSPKPLSQAVLESKERQTFGHSRIRLMPKKHGFRAIANLGQSFIMKQVPRTTKARCYPRNGYKEIHIPSTNRVLSNALAALNYVRKSYPELFGSAVFGFADIHAKLGKFKAAIHTLRGEHVDLPRFYIAKVDIRRAFDTIPQRKLLSLLQEKLPDEEYSVSKYWTVSPSFGRFRKAFLKHAMPSSKSGTFESLAHILSRDAKQLVFGDLAETEFIDAKAVCRLVGAHVTQNTVRAAPGLLQQKRGIPQGSVLSSHLCNFLYGQMEHEHLRGVIDPEKTIILRIVDDFLLISTEEAQAATFLDVMYRGLPDYGCEINKGKTLANFDISFAGYTVQRTAARTFPWCGILVDTHTLDVYADYGRQRSGPGIEWSISLGAAKSPGFSLRQKILASVRSRVNRLYMDSTFNSRETVLLNLFQNFMFCAKKFHVVCRQMLTHRNNSDFLVSVVEGAIVLVFTLLRAKCNSKDIAPTEVAWLGLFAFRRVLSRKQTQYTAVLSFLDSRMRQPEFALAAQRYRWIVSSPLNKDVLSISY